MNINSLSIKDLDRVVELYVQDRNKFHELCSLEEYCEQFCHRCECGVIVSDIDGCEECDNAQEIDNTFQEFELNKERILYNIL